MNLKGRKIYEDEAGNKLFKNKEGYFAKNPKGELISKHGSLQMLKEAKISTKSLQEVYLGNKKK